ncbi:MAG: amino acid ABC transporter ATP-binding protein [Proteobacteria bacterium]|nr:amino acid ABC transporter ATP-binding protein [Pseudomonadota bacterium]
MRDVVQQPRAEELVNIRALNKWYGDFHALCDVELDVVAGETVAICGRSGSGKSTLIRCIAGLEEFQTGELVVHGIALSPQSSLNHRKVSGVGMVFQNFNLFPHMTVMENLTIGPVEVARVSRSEARARAMHQLERLQMGAFADRYPSTLSGGQQQRAAIARSLCLNPRLMLFDEPTSALDPELRSEVRTTINALARDGMTMIIVTHEIELARDVSSRIVWMDDGAVGRTEAGAPPTYSGNGRGGGGLGGA